MDVMSITFTVSGLLVAVWALRLQSRSYRLQREQGIPLPGQHLDPEEASQALEEVDEDPVRAIASDAIFVEHEKKAVGYIKKQPIGVYLDLHSASCDPRKRTTLATSLAAFVRAELGEPGKRNLVATPREGNLLVGAEVAALLRCEYLMIRTVTAPRFGYPIEGSFTPGTTAIMVDDLCMEGAFLQRCVRNMRRYGINVSNCFCLFERLDGDSREALASISVQLHAKYQIDDDMLKLMREGSEPAALPGRTDLR